MGLNYDYYRNEYIYPANPFEAVLERLERDLRQRSSGEQGWDNLGELGLNDHTKTTTGVRNYGTRTGIRITSDGFVGLDID